MENEPTLYRCRCGRTRTYSYVRPAPCHPCGWCGTNLATSRALAAPAVPHETYEEEYVLDEKGEKIITCTICKFCNQIPPMLDSERNPFLAVIHHV